MYKNGRPHTVERGNQRYSHARQESITLGNDQTTGAISQHPRPSTNFQMENLNADGQTPSARM